MSMILNGVTVLEIIALLTKVIIFIIEGFELLACLLH